MDKEAWCERFVNAWSLFGPDPDESFAQAVAERSYEQEGDAKPEAAARDHVAYNGAFAKSQSH